MSLELIVFVFMAGIALGAITAPVGKAVGRLIASRVGEWGWRRAALFASAVVAVFLAVFETVEVVFATAFWNVIAARQTDLLTVFEATLVVLAVGLAILGIVIAVWFPFFMRVRRKENEAKDWHAWKIDSVEPADGGLVRAVAENVEKPDRFGIEFLSKDRGLKAGDGVVAYYAQWNNGLPAVIDVRRAVGKGSIMDGASLDGRTGTTRVVDLWAIKLTAAPRFERPDGGRKPQA